MSALNILLVDDDRYLGITLSEGLRKATGGATSVVFCSSGMEAQELLAAQTFDLVISDFHMPGMSGLELLKKINQDHRETSLVLITAYATEALFEELHRLGIAYIAKPFDLPLLVQRIKELTQGEGRRDGATPTGLLNSSVESKIGWKK